MGVRIVVRRGLKRSVMYAESEELHYAYGHDWNPMPDMELERWGGVRIFGTGVREKGGSDEPPEPPLVTGLHIDNCPELFS